MTKLLITLLILTASSVAFAQDPHLVPSSGSSVADEIMRIIGSLTVLLTALAAVLPKAWKFTQLLARVSVDLKGIGTKKE